ncbi:50S ribosomal protein L3 [Candidatus Sumerlaeota bacterium]|nr:50S ribosomal protein L3 [Candidatus Sumerlaeota bacterium]
MTLGLIGRKLGMTQCFDESGVLAPVTLIEAGPCVVLQKKVVSTDGYNALQLGFGDARENKITRPMAGHLAPSNSKACRYVREVRINDPDRYEVGQTLDLDIFEDGEKVDIVGTSKGRGFQGVIKRHGQHRGPESHGSMYHRRVGSMGMSADPSRVMKGKRLPGQMGNKRMTAQGLKIMKRDKSTNIIAVRGSVPGSANGMVIIRKSVKAKRS